MSVRTHIRAGSKADVKLRVIMFSVPYSVSYYNVMVVIIFAVS